MHGRAVCGCTCTHANFTTKTTTTHLVGAASRLLGDGLVLRSEAEGFIARLRRLGQLRRLRRRRLSRQQRRVRLVLLLLRYLLRYLLRNLALRRPTRRQHTTAEAEGCPLSASVHSRCGISRDLAHFEPHRHSRTARGSGKRAQRMESWYHLLVPRRLLHLLQRATLGAAQVLPREHLDGAGAQPRVVVAVARGPGQLPILRVAQVPLLARVFWLCRHPPPHTPNNIP